MPMADLMLTGLELMLLGMGIVFGFLILLVFVLKGMSWLAVRLEDQTQDQAAAPATLQPAATEQVPVPVIAAAVARYRASQNR